MKGNSGVRLILGNVGMIDTAPHHLVDSRWFIPFKTHHDSAMK